MERFFAQTACGRFGRLDPTRLKTTNYSSSDPIGYYSLVVRSCAVWCTTFFDNNEIQSQLKTKELNADTCANKKRAIITCFPFLSDVFITPFHEKCVLTEQGTKNVQCFLSIAILLTISLFNHTLWRRGWISINNRVLLYRLNISRTIRSAPFTRPVNTSILKTSSPMYSHAIVTAGRLLSTTGDPLDKKAE